MSTGQIVCGAKLSAVPNCLPTWEVPGPHLTIVKEVEEAARVTMSLSVGASIRACALLKGENQKNLLLLIDLCLKTVMAPG